MNIKYLISLLCVLLMDVTSLIPLGEIIIIWKFWLKIKKKKISLSKRKWVFILLYTSDEKYFHDFRVKKISKNRKKMKNKKIRFLLTFS